jgi:signal transduction histidine kinase
MIVGGIWILFSDSLITRFTNDIDVLTRLATAKGWLFILVTSLLLYYLIRNYALEKKIIEEELIKAKEKAEESDKLKSEFLAQMSHEIRTPLNVILSYNSLLKDELVSNLDKEQINAFAAVDTAGKRLFRTIDLILSMAELQSGNIDVNLSDVNIYYVLKGLIKEFEYAASEKNLVISCMMENNITPVVRSDEYIISEVFQNLIDNAIKFTLEGHIEVKVYKDEYNKFCVSVKDTGIGISEKYIGKIFLPFSQEESGYSRKFEGNGLGLALVKNYLKLINAEIRVDSTKGVGSNFLVKFN